ncbi:hypothetical protein AN2351V1_1610 [Citrobacter koseri]|nr:hypothetical protein AN2351V1_1610 [Citrobacter koseri]CAH6023257.1 hypothetical protein AN2351V1_1610 [Citrobacter koseri]
MIQPSFKDIRAHSRQRQSLAGQILQTVENLSLRTHSDEDKYVLQYLPGMSKRASMIQTEYAV